MKTSDFDFELPEELIAQTPLERRDTSRLLTLNKTTGEIEHHHFYELPQFLRPGDCLVLNNSRVLPARLIGRRLTGGVCEVLLLVDKGDNVWECLVRPGRKLKPGAQVVFGGGELTATIEAEVEDGKRLVRRDDETPLISCWFVFVPAAVPSTNAGGCASVRVNEARTPVWPALQTQTS